MKKTMITTNWRRYEIGCNPNDPNDESFGVIYRGEFLSLGSYWSAHYAPPIVAHGRNWNLPMDPHDPVIWIGSEYGEQFVVLGHIVKTGCCEQA